MNKVSVGNKYSQELYAKVRTGELVYVSEYTRGDGTKVTGYYRSYPRV